MTAASKEPSQWTGAPRTAPAPRVQNGVNDSLAALLKLEDEVRSAETSADLLVLAANETLRLTGARQIFVLKSTVKGHEVAAVSSIASFDRNAPLIQSVERAIAKLAANSGLGELREFEAAAFAPQNDSVLLSYPFRWMMWVPLSWRGSGELGGLLLARESPWTKPDGIVAERIGRVVSFAWASLDTGRRRVPRSWLNRRVAALLVAALAISMLIPVPMTTLAPFEAGSKDELVVAAPLDGVIEAIDVEPNAAVIEGQILLRLSDTVHRNKLEVAEREVAVAAARLTKTEQLAFGDARGRHELGITRTELALKTAERDFAKDLLAKTTIRASRAGIAVFTDKRDLIGKPVATGERILSLSDPARVELRIDVPVSDAMILKPGSAARIFLDTDPFNPRSAVVRHADYLARLRSDVLAFRAVADLSDNSGPPPRLGGRGTAQLIGDKVPLGFYLFRRPISALRQRIGL